jgi:hypothetical protein
LSCAKPLSVPFRAAGISSQTVTSPSRLNHYEVTVPVRVLIAREVVSVFGYLLPV